MLASGCPVGLLQGLEVYRSNTHGTRVRAPEPIYPVCRRVLGSECFQPVAAPWVREMPSVDGELNREGEGFPERFSGLAAKRPEFASLPWPPDLARLEWHLHRAYHGPGPTPLDLRVLETAADPKAWPPENLPPDRNRRSAVAERGGLDEYIDPVRRLDSAYR